MSAILESQQPDSVVVEPGSDDRHFVTALARGLSVLACFRSGNRTLSNQELSVRCNLPKSTVSRLTSTLVKLGYLTQDEGSGKYKLGMATLALGVGMLSKLDIREVARPYMQELADYSQAMVSLGVRDRLSMLYIENCRSQAALTLSLDVGARIPIATSSMGRGYLALASDTERQEIANRLAELDTGSNQKIMSGVNKAIAEHQKIGITTSFGDWQKDVNAIAAGFKLSETEPIMVITCGAPSFYVSESFLLEKVRPRLLQTIEKIKGQMGH